MRTPAPIVTRTAHQPAPHHVSSADARSVVARLACALSTHGDSTHGERTPRTHPGGKHADATKEVRSAPAMHTPHAAPASCPLPTETAHPVSARAPRIGPRAELDDVRHCLHPRRSAGYTPRVELGGGGCPARRVPVGMLWRRWFDPLRLIRLHGRSARSGRTPPCGPRGRRRMRGDGSQDGLASSGQAK